MPSAHNDFNHEIEARESRSKGLDQVLYNNLELRASATTYLILLCFISIITIIGLLLFLAQSSADGAPLFTTKNNLLLLSLLAQCTYVITQTVHVRNAKSDALEIAMSFSLTFAHVLYTWYQWLRSYDVFYTVSSARALFTIQLVIVAKTVFSFVPTIIEVMPWDTETTDKYYYPLRGLAYSLTMTIDAFFTYTFIQYVFSKTGKERSDKDVLPLFRVVARGGLIASALFLLGLLIYLGMAAVIVQGTNVKAYVALLLAQDTICVAMLVTLVVQKVQLLRLRKAR
ncbi:hypothetical protein BDR26DRAFT_855919 [Obelidium mucronatum]|nr:hypothetical protein BDR26DRAFT_855919 [Obelidium mucronatum]